MKSLVFGGLIDALFGCRQARNLNTGRGQNVAKGVCVGGGGSFKTMVKTTTSYITLDCGEKNGSMMQNTLKKAEIQSLRATNRGKTTTNFPVSVFVSWLKNHTVVTIVLKIQ